MAAAYSSLPAVLQGFSELPARSKLGLLFSTAALIALATGSWMWSQAPDYRVLLAHASDRDGGAIIAALGQMNIPYKFSEAGGAILVPANQVHDARLKLAAQGLPKGGSVGFELMENQKFGTTQFQEQINFQRALEGELARTIQSLSAVASARVHLAIPKQSAFLREQLKPSASVLVNLHPGKTIERTQVAGIIHLVASSVPDLAARAVSVLDQHGTLLSADGESKAAGGLDAGQLSYLNQIETGYSRRILDILEPVLGRNNVRAQVSAEIDFSETESVAETYKPNQNPADAAVRSQQQSEEPRGSSTAAAQGVPGALSNQPPAAVAAPLAGVARPGTVAAESGPSARRDSTVNYEVDKTVRHTRNPNRSIKRLSAAVVVNYRKPAEPPTGKAETSGDAPKDERAVAVPARAASAALTPEEMQQITALVKETIGFSQSRGDSLNVVNVAFSAAEIENPPDVPVWQQPENVNLAKEIGRNILFGILILYLLFGILRPLMRQLAVRPPPPVEFVPPQLESAAEVETTFNDNLQTVRQIAKQDPKAVANVVRNWVGSNG